MLQQSRACSSGLCCCVHPCPCSSCLCCLCAPTWVQDLCQKASNDAPVVCLTLLISCSSGTPGRLNLSIVVSESRHGGTTLVLNHPSVVMLQATMPTWARRCRSSGTGWTNSNEVCRYCQLLQGRVPQRRSLLPAPVAAVLVALGSAHGNHDAAGVRAGLLSSCWFHLSCGLTWYP